MKQSKIKQTKTKKSKGRRETKTKGSKGSKGSKGRRETKKKDLRGGGAKLDAVIDYIKPAERTSAVKGAIKDTGKDAIYKILTMENPIVYAYQVIERNVFGWDTTTPPAKMGATGKKVASFFGLEKKNKDLTLKDFIKGGEALKPQPPTPPTK